jgi:hypothetical protein
MKMKELFSYANDQSFQATWSLLAWKNRAKLFSISCKSE